MYRVCMVIVSVLLQHCYFKSYINNPKRVFIHVYIYNIYIIYIYNIYIIYILINKTHVSDILFFIS